MGSFSYLTIADYPTFDNKNDYYEDVINLLFQPEDYLQEIRLCKTKNRLFWGDAYENEESSFNFRGFRQKAGICLSRLKIFGYSLKKARNEWNQAKKYRFNEYHFSDYDFPLKKTSFTAYYKELQNIINNKLINYEQARDTLQNVLISDSLMIPGLSTGSALLCILSSVDQNEWVEYELSEVLSSGWITKKPHERINFEKIILLTEGRTDSFVISNCIKILYPELFPYYQFMDFEGLKVEGGASALVRTVKSFAGARVSHPIIALFDNDTAGISELSKIPKDLPENIKVMKLPDIHLAKKYPTIGPGGLKIMNINTLACGIELYLGSEILTHNNDYYPIRWSNFDNYTSQYHGAIEAKEEVHKKFKEKLSKGESWKMPEMELLLSKIFNAF